MPEHKTNTETSKELPKYIDRGNSASDAQNYQNAKEEWLRQNPLSYKEQTNTLTQKQVISNEAFNKMTSEKQAIVLNNPDLYVIGEDNQPVKIIIDAEEYKKMPTEKQTMIKNNPNRYEIKSLSQSENTKTIVYRKELDKMPAEKVDLIKANPDFYMIID